MPHGIWLLKKSFDYYINQSKWLVKNIIQKCQNRTSQKIHGLVTMDRVKMTKKFFWCLSRMGPFLPKILVKKKRIIVVNAFKGNISNCGVQFMQHNNMTICYLVNHDVTTKHNTQINSKLKTRKIKKKTFIWT
jgi:hypothetical protein